VSGVRYVVIGAFAALAHVKRLARLNFTNALNARRLSGQ
jgi:hypothetical protein